MAKDGRKLELYEILAAKRAKGKAPLGLDAAAKQTPAPAQEQEATPAPGLIIDDALEEQRYEALRERPPEEEEEPPPLPDAGARESSKWRERVDEPARRQPARRESGPLEAGADRPEKQARRGATGTAEPVEQEAPRPRSPREIVIALDTGLIFFTVVLALLGCSYFIGYKRGQEERPAGLAGVAEIETADPDRLNLRNLSPAPRAAIRPPEQDYTLIIRKEPATENDLPERLELELAEALARGRNQAGRDVPGFIFRTVGSDPHFILAVGLGQSANDQGLNELLRIYYAMEGVTLSREAAPYRGCRIAPVRELGTPVY